MRQVFITLSSRTLGIPDTIQRGKRAQFENTSQHEQFQGNCKEKEKEMESNVK